MAGEEGTYAQQFGDEFQSHILSVMARVMGFVLRYRTALDSSYFISNLHQIVAGALLKHADEYHSLPTQVTLVELCKELADPELADKLKTAVGKLFKRDISDAPTVIEKAVEFGKTQAMVNAVIEAGEEIDKGNREVTPLIHEAQLVGEDILNLGVDFKATLANRMTTYMTPPDKVQEWEIIPTGLAHLDYALEGGLSRGELGVVLAPPKRGKTTTLINLGFGCMTSVLGFNVVHYTCEMADRKIARRYDDRVLGNDVQFRRSDPKKFTQRLKQKVKTLVTGGLFIKGYPTRTATPGMIRNHMYLLAGEGFVPDLVLVDYADIMKPERRLGEMRHEQAGIYEDLRQMAGIFNVAVWTASQAPRGALDKALLDIGDFAEAYEKAAIMDAGIAFCQTPDERLKSECRLALIGLRSAEDMRMILCEINRKKCFLRTKGLIDPGYVPIPTPLDCEEDQEAVLQTTVTLHKAVDGFKKKGSGIEGKVSSAITKGKKKGVKKKPSKKVDQGG